MRFFKTSVLLLLMSSLLLLAPSSCKMAGGGDAVTPNVPNTLVSSTLIGQFTTDQLRSRFTGTNVAFQLLIRYPISVYRITYTTTNTDGKSITASGALLIPTVNAGTSVPMLSIQHGTITSDDGAPSNYQSGSEAYTFGSVFASQGYIIAAPDYIGYGASKNVPHTYEHRSGLATASLDMLRAARQVLTSQNANWDKRLMIAGYSEGGYATLALQKKIEEETGSEFNLVASSCGAGAYDKPAFMKQILNNTTSTDPSISRLYLWVLLTYDRIYNLNRPATYYFKEPYATRIAASGYTANLGGLSFNQVVTDSFKQAINNGTDTDFLKAVQDNDIHDWKPRTNTRLYHGDADDTVLFLNSQNAYDAMRARGATNVQLIRLSGANHATGILGYITGTYDFFNSLQ